MQRLGFLLCGKNEKPVMQQEHKYQYNQMNKFSPSGFDALEGEGQKNTQRYAEHEKMAHSDTCLGKYSEARNEHKKIQKINFLGFLVGFAQHKAGIPTYRKKDQQSKAAELETKPVTGIG